MKKNLFVFFIWLLWAEINAQQKHAGTTSGDSTKSSKWLHGYIPSPGDSLKALGDVMGAIEQYRKFCKGPDDNPAQISNYSQVLAINHENDSAFKYLNILMSNKRLVSIGSDMITTWIVTDEAYIHLHNDPRWKDVENNCILIMEKSGKYLNWDLAKRLWKMKTLDQAYRAELTIAEEHTGHRSTVVLALWDLINIFDNQNQTELDTIIKSNGWPKISEVGIDAAEAAFLIIQHAGIAKQKIYLPVIKEYCEKREARWEDYALMYDRVQVSEHKSQRYGSQLQYNEKTGKYELCPLEDESMVEEWRMHIGLMALAKYVAAWGITFKPKR